MALLNWDEASQRIVEFGISRGVLYPRGKAGVVWNGLTAVTERPSGGEETGLYSDNHKYASFRSFESFEATIEAYMYPDEFGECDGSVKVSEGIVVGQQRRLPFDFCYRTEVMHAADSIYDSGYQLHLVFNATASPSERNYSTLNESTEAASFSWEIQTIPFLVNGHKAASTMVIDSTKVDRIKMEALETILYGRGSEPPRMPDPDEVIRILKRLDLHQLLMNVLKTSGNWIWDTFNFREDTVPIAIDREAETHVYFEPASGTQYNKPAIAYSLLNESEDGRRNYMLVVVDTENPSRYVTDLKAELDLQGEEVIKSGDTYYYTYTLYI